MQIISPSSTLLNPLATPAQLSTSSSNVDGIPISLENSVRYAGICLTQAAGVLLRLPQDIIAQAIVVFTRFWLGIEGGSFKVFAAADISAASIYLMAKLSAHSKSPRNVLNVYSYLSITYNPFEATFPAETSKRPDPCSYCLSETAYAARHSLLRNHETLLLRTLGFQLHVTLPHSLCINYLQTLDTFSAFPSQPQGSTVAKRALAHLNTLLFSPQLIYLTHQPWALATAAIYLAAREASLKLPEGAWWEVFDTERGELGFLVVAALSMQGWVEKEAEEWIERGRKVPMTVRELLTEMGEREKEA